MTAGNFDDVIFSATLVPHRSLSRRGFVILMSVIAGLWFLTGAYFWSLGAWPVTGFVGLDVIAVWLAFILNYRAARTVQDIEVTRAALVIRTERPGGRAQEFRFNPLWVRLEVEELDDEGVARIAIRSRDGRVPVGAFLNPEDRTSFARAFGAALAEAKR